MVISKVSVLTGVRHEMDLPITHEQIRRWQSGVMAQDAFPHLDDDQREFLISGATKEEWEEFMKEEKEE